MYLIVQMPTLHSLSNKYVYPKGLHVKCVESYCKYNTSTHTGYVRTNCHNALMRFTQFAHNVAKMFLKNNDSLLVNSVRTIFFCHHIILTMLTFDKKILKLIVYLSINTYICTYNYAYHYLLSLLE